MGKCDERSLRYQMTFTSGAIFFGINFSSFNVIFLNIKKRNYIAKYAIGWESKFYSKEGEVFIV